MTNAIPGSSIEATQGTTSAQPISDNRGYSFEGDDRIEGTVPAADHILIAFAGDFRASGTAYVIDIADGAGSSQLIGLIRPTASEMRLYTINGSGNNNTVNLSVDPQQRCVAAAVFDAPESQSRYAVRNESGVTGAGDTNFSGSFTFDTLSIGGSHESSEYVDGVGFEVFVAMGVDRKFSGLKTLRDRIASRHGIPLS